MKREMSISHPHSIMQYVQNPFFCRHCLKCFCACRGPNDEISLRACVQKNLSGNGGKSRNIIEIGGSLLELDVNTKTSKTKPTMYKYIFSFVCSAFLHNWQHLDFIHIDNSCLLIKKNYVCVSVVAVKWCKECKFLLYI